MELKMQAHETHAEVVKYSGEETCVVIPQQYDGKPVTTIAEGAFLGARSLENLIVPDTLEVIEHHAFANCRNLQYIGPAPADGTLECGPGKSRTSVLHNVRAVGQYAFFCSGIRKIEFHAEGVHIGGYAFADCIMLETVVFEGTRGIAMEKRAFARSGIRAIRGELTLLEFLPEEAFAYCRRLTDVSFFDVDKIHDRCFFNCSRLKNLDIGIQREIGKNAFTGCTALEEVPAEWGIEPETWRAPDGTVTFDPDKSVRGQVEPKDIGARRKGVPGRRPRPTFTAETEDEQLQELKAKLEEALAWLEDIAEQPMFHLEQVECSEEWGTEVPKLVGMWNLEEDGYVFEIGEPEFLVPCKLKLSQNERENLHRYRPLFEYAQKKGEPVVLLGETDESGYTVHEFVPELGADWGAKQSRQFMSNVVERLRRVEPNDTQPTLEREAFIHGGDELDTFFNICGSALPEWVVEAYYKNKRESIRGASDERKHARYALELLLNIEWQAKPGKVPEVATARKILDDAFHGLEEVKTRILEVVAQIRHAGALPKWGILLNGPAGTGKTTIAKAVAQLLDMPLIQMDMSSLGTGREAISGSSRIYSNASPGLLLTRMFEVRSSTAVLLANEVDKTPEEGRAASDTLLTILDKTGFYENFLEEIIPTDNVFCIGTCNDIDKISQPLRDRFLVIDIPPYTKEEKRVIWSDFVLPKALAGARVEADRLTLTPGATELLVSGYATQPGVRDLEQCAERVVGDYCRCADESQDPDSFTREYDEDDLKRLFGPARELVRHFAALPGQVNAAFYYDGVAHFFRVEASVRPGTGEFEVIGAMSPLQKDYAKVAYHCVQNTTGFDLRRYDVGIFIPHVIPEGARNYVGLACYAAICSRLLDKNLGTAEACFVGGCDMNGSLYFDEYDLEPLLRAMQDRGVTTLYAPMGTNRLLEGSIDRNRAVTIVEAFDAKTLFGIAAS